MATQGAKHAKPNGPDGAERGATDHEVHSLSARAGFAVLVPALYQAQARKMSRAVSDYSS